MKATQLSRNELETLLLASDEDGLKLDEGGQLRPVKAEAENRSRPTPEKSTPKRGLGLPADRWD